MGVCASKPSTVESGRGDAVDAPTPHVAVQRPTPREMLDISIGTTNPPLMNPLFVHHVLTFDQREEVKQQPMPYNTGGKNTSGESTPTVSPVKIMPVRLCFVHVIGSSSGVC
jgi:hypothetical protein